MKDYTLEELDALVEKYTKARKEKIEKMFSLGKFPLVSKDEAEMIVNGQLGKASRRYRDRNKLPLHQAEVVIELVKNSK